MYQLRGSLNRKLKAARFGPSRSRRAQAPPLAAALRDWFRGYFVVGARTLSC